MFLHAPQRWRRIILKINEGFQVAATFLKKNSHHCSVAKLCLTLCDPMDWSMPGFPVLHYLLKLAQTHVHIKLVMPSDHLILFCPLFLLPSIFPSIRVFSNELALHVRWPKYWSFSISLSNEYSELISFGIDWLVWSPCCLRNSQESSSAPQFKSISSSVLGLLYGPTLTSTHDYWKNCSFD